MSYVSCIGHKDLQYCTAHSKTYIFNCRSPMSVEYGVVCTFARLLLHFESFATSGIFLIEFAVSSNTVNWALIPCGLSANVFKNIKPELFSLRLISSVRWSIGTVDVHTKTKSQNKQTSNSCHFFAATEFQTKCNSWIVHSIFEFDSSLSSTSHATT